MIIYDLRETVEDMQIVADYANPGEVTTITVNVPKYREAFGTFIDEGYLYAVIVPADHVPSTPYEMGLNLCKQLKCGGHHEEQITTPITLEGNVIGGVGDWLLLYNFLFV